MLPRVDLVFSDSQTAGATLMGNLITVADTATRTVAGVAMASSNKTMAGAAGTSNPCRLQTRDGAQTMGNPAQMAAAAAGILVVGEARHRPISRRRMEGHRRRTLGTILLLLRDTKEMGGPAIAGVTKRRRVVIPMTLS